MNSNKPAEDRHEKSASVARRRAAVRRGLRIGEGLTIGGLTAVALLVVGGLLGAAGEGASPVAPRAASARSRPSSDGSIVVAVALGVSGTDAADALGPYEVFARSKKFQVYTVAATAEPVALNGGLSVMPTYTFDDIASGRARKPDVVVVPAVNDPTGASESALRTWVTSQAADGAQVLGVCAGARVLAATGLLDGRDATSHWSRLASLTASNPKVHWVSGQRFVQDGAITTSAGVTSGIPAALHLVRQLAGDSEAEQVGRAMHYPSWSLDQSTEIPVQEWSITDLSAGLNLVLPWFRPTVGVALSNGISESDAVAAFEVNEYASAARLIPLSEGHSITTQHGLVIQTTPLSELTTSIDRVIAPGVSSSQQVASPFVSWASHRGVDITPLRGGNDGSAFDAALADLAAGSSRTTATSVAKMLEYPIEDVRLPSGFDLRVPVLLSLALLVSVAVGVLPTIVRRHRRSRIARRSS